MAFDTNLQSVTQTHLVPKAVDTVLTGNPLTLKLLGNAKKWVGTQIKRSVIVEKQSNGGAFSGLDTFDLNKSGTKVQLAFDPKGIYKPVVIEGMDRDVNASDPARALDLVKNAVEEAGNSLADDIAGHFYGSNAATTDAPQGLDDIVDDGGDVATYGGQTRATYTTLKSNETDVTGNLDTLDTLRASDSLARHGKDKVTLHVCSETKWDEFESLLQPQVQYNHSINGYRQMTRDSIVAGKEALGAEVGFDSLYYRGAAIVADEQAPELGWFGINLNHLAWYGLESANPEYKPVKIGNNETIEGEYTGKGVSPHMGIHFTGLRPSYNQYAEAGFIIVLGNLVSWNPNRHFKINFTA